jgi:twinkle protein
MPRCKDANEVLMRYGPEAIKEAIEHARHTPIEGVYEVSDISDQVDTLYEKGLPPGLSLKLRGLTTDDGKELLTVHTSLEYTILGIPGMGKSTFWDNVMIIMAREYGWRWAVFSPETQPPELAIALLAEKYIGKPFGGKHVGRERMTRDELREAKDWIDDHFKFILPESGEFTIDTILEKTKVLIMRYGIKGLVIDPWNNLDDSRPAQQTSAEYLGKSLNKINAFKSQYRMCVAIVVHPSKLTKDPKTGKYPIPTPYDAMGGSHWNNKSDVILTVNRDKEDESQLTDIIIQKMKFRHLGGLGVGHLAFDYPTGIFFDDPNEVVYAETVMQSNRKKKVEPLPKQTGENWWS